MCERVSPISSLKKINFVMLWFDVKCCGIYVFSIYNCDKQHPNTKPPELSIDSDGHLSDPDRLECQSRMEIPLKTSLFDVI